MAVLLKPITLAGSKGRREVNGLFDSGASRSCIQPDLARELAVVEALPEPLEFTTAKDKESLTAVERVTLDFYLKGYRFSDEFIVVPGLSEPLLIGAATLQKWRLKLDFEAEDILIDPKVTRLRL